MSARAVAGEVLDRVMRGGAYSNVLVRTATEELAAVDRRFTQRLVFGALRHLVRIDRALAAVSDRTLERLDPVVLSTLRVATEELLFIGAPPHAAVDGAVTAIGERGRARAAGFVNAVLRALARAGEPPLPDNEGEAAALRSGVPPWLLDQLASSLGGAGAADFLVASDRDPSIGIRRRGAAPVPGEPVPGVAGAFLSTEPAAVSAAVAAGDAVVMDPASVAVGIAVGATRGMTVADLAAAPGGKTLQLWDAMEQNGLLVAGDRHERRAGRASRRVGSDVHWLVADARWPPLQHGVFDRVLLDAPCTGLGTLRRRPEIRHRIRPPSSAEAGHRQRAMVEAALPLLRPGGRLVYSVCTVLTPETIDVVAGLGARPPDDLPGLRTGDGLLLAPHLTGTDGMFIAVIDA